MPVPKTPRTSAAAKLLTVKEVAELDRCSEKTVRRAIDAGSLEVIRIGVAGRLLRIHPDAHRAYRQS